LLGRPWFKQAKVKQDWGNSKLTVRKGKKKVQMNMISTMELPRKDRALYVQSINMVDHINDDEEEAFLQANKSIIPVYVIDVIDIWKQYQPFEVPES